MDGGGWWATVHGVTESDMTDQLHFHVEGEFKCYGYLEAIIRFTV